MKPYGERRVWCGDNKTSGGHARQESKRELMGHYDEIVRKTEETDARVLRMQDRLDALTARIDREERIRVSRPPIPIRTGPLEHQVLRAAVLRSRDGLTREVEIRCVYYSPPPTYHMPMASEAAAYMAAGFLPPPPIETRTYVLDPDSVSKAKLSYFEGT